MTRPKSRLAMPEEVAFPVTPMLDMAFQLLAFFVLTFQVPSRETRLDLELPVAPVALPGRALPRASVSGPLGDELETNVPIRAEADEKGGLKSLRLGEAAVASPEALGERLQRYGSLLEGRPLRIVLIADDALRYEIAAQLIGVCSEAGVSAIRLANPGGREASERSP